MHSEVNIIQRLQLFYATLLCISHAYVTFLERTSFLIATTVLR